MEHPFIGFLSERDLIPPHVATRFTQRKGFMREPIGMIAVSHGLIKAQQIDEILDRQRECRNKRFGEIAVELGCLTETQVDTLVLIQQFRSSQDIAEALALAGVMSMEDAARHLGAFLVRDREIAAMLAD